MMKTLEVPSQSLVLNYSETYTVDWKGILSEPANRFVALDIETNGVDPYKDPSNFEARGFSLAVKVGDRIFSDYFPVTHKDRVLSEDVWRPILQLATGEGKTNIVHNYGADAKFIEYFGEALSADYIDTMRLAHLDDENYGQTKDGYSLEGCCQRYLHEAGKEKSAEWEMMLELVGWAGMPFILQRPYASHDARQTLRLAFVLMKKTQREPGLKEYFKKVDAPNQVVLKKMKELGIKVDLEFCEKMELECISQMKAIEDETGRKFHGTGSVKDMQQLFWEELKLPIIYNKRKVKHKDGTVTVKETPSLDAKVMERYELILGRDENPIARKVLAFRGWQKALTAFYQPYQNLVDADGRIRTSYKPHGTVTGRYSSSEPNLQQIPKESDKPWNGEVKKAFIPEEGYELWEFDYSQLEFRLAALLCGEKKLLEVFNSDRDIFKEMSLELGLERQQCKTLTYSIQYGAGAQRIMDVFGYSRSKAIETINSWYSNYPSIRAMVEKCKREAIRYGKVELWSGRYRHFINPKAESHKAFNSANQGGAADIVKIAMNNVARELPEVRILLQIHDAFVFEFPVGQVDTYRSQVLEIMQNPVPQDVVKFKVDAHILGSK